MNADQQKIKIAYLINSLEIGGAERQLVELLKNLDRQSFDPLLYTLGPPEKNLLAKELEPSGIPVRALSLFGSAGGGRPGKIFSAFKGFLSLFKELKREKPAIFHGYLFWSYILGGLAAKAAGVPIIITSRRSLHTCVTPLNNPVLKLLAQAVNGFTAHIIGNSQAVVEDTIRNEHLPADKVSCIYNCFFSTDTPLSQEEADTFARQWKRSEDELLIGVIANLIPYKGHEYLLRAVPEIKKTTNQPFRIILVGRDGGYQGTLATLAEELNIEDDIVFAGPVPQAARLLPLFSLSVLPSLEEGFSNTVIESMASGVPVVATAVGGNPEAMVDGETGFLVPPKNASALAEKIGILLKNSDIRKKMSEAAPIRVQNEFSLEKMLKETATVYQKLVCTAPRSGKRNRDTTE